MTDYGKTGYVEQNDFHGVRKWNVSSLMLFVGVFLGSVFCNFVLGESVKLGYDEFSVYNLILQYIPIEAGKLYLFVLERRSLQFLLFLLIVRLLPSKLQSVIFSFTFGFVFGIYISSQVILDGIKGVLLGVLALFPHWCFYLIAVFSCLKIGSIMKKGQRFIWVVGFVFIGYALEVLLQPQMLYFFSCHLK